jgi:prepilin-type N-terminal cleavage/methylation domain-containing protein
MVSVVRPPRPRGFTLVEVLMVLGMVALLCSLTFPSYASHLKKGRARTAAIELATLALAMENKLQQQPGYPSWPEGTPATPALFPGWRPTMDEHFLYTVESNEAGFKLQAVGRAGLHGCTLTLDSSGRRSASADCGLAGWS